MKHQTVSKYCLGFRLETEFSGSDPGIGERGRSGDNLWISRFDSAANTALCAYFQGCSKEFSLMDKTGHLVVAYFQWCSKEFSLIDKTGSLHANFPKFLGFYIFPLPILSPFPFKNFVWKQLAPVTITGPWLA